MIFKDMESFYNESGSNEEFYYQSVHPSITEGIESFFTNNPDASGIVAKSKLHTLIAEHFEPIIFFGNPFFYEMGIKPSTSWGHSSRPVDYLKEKLSKKVFSKPAVMKAYSDFDALRAQIGESWSTHIGLYRTPTPGFDTDHTSVGYSMLFDVGISGILENIKQKYSDFEPGSEEYDFCKACEESCYAVIKIANKFAEEAEKSIAECKTETEIKYMKMIAESARHIPENPPRNFYEGLAMIWFMREVTASLEAIGISVLGQADLLLGKLYEKDIAENIITEEAARELIRLWLMPTDIKFRSNNSPWPETSTCITLGGGDRNGNVVYNDVTRLIIEVHSDMNLVAPKLNLRYSEKSPDSYLQLISKKIIEGHNNFALSCDDVVIPSLEKCSVEAEDARRYVNGGCQETIIEGAGHTAGAYLYVILPSILDMSLNTSDVTESLDSDIKSGLPHLITDAADFDEFYSAFLNNSKNVIQKACEKQVVMGLEQKNLNPCPLFSSTHMGCIEDGKDYTDGGGKYNLSTICMCGIATLTDSLYAIKTLVYDRHELTLGEFAGILLNNWENAEELRRACIKLPKYGHGNADVDSIAKRFIKDLNEFIIGITNERGGKSIMSMFSYYLYKTFAPYVRATADGRRDGDLFSQGISASRIQEYKSVTELFETVKYVEYDHISGVSVLDIVLTPGIDETRLASLIKIAGKYGCANLQPNYLSVEELKDAQLHPENYKNLIVRISGLSAYFVNLEKTVQNEIISRSVLK